MKRTEIIIRQSALAKVLAVLVCLTMLLPQFSFAGDGTQWGSTPAGTYNREVPALSDKTPENPDPAPPASTPVTNTDPWGNDSPLSLPDNKIHEAFQQLTAEEATAVMTRISELVDMVLEALKAQYKNAPDNALLEEIGKYEAASAVLREFLENQTKSTDPSTDFRASAYNALKNVSDILGRGTPGTQNAGNPSSNGVIPRLTGYIAAGIRMVQERMREDASLPEAKSFSAEKFSEEADKESGSEEDRSDLTRSSKGTEISSQAGYQVLGSVVLNRETARVYELLNPSPKLHPFLRWLFYGRHLTQVRAERYLAARAKVREICMRAKAGEGLIRYKGKIMESFLPLPGDESGGTFELVRRM